MTTKNILDSKYPRPFISTLSLDIPYLAMMASTAVSGIMSASRCVLTHLLAILTPALKAGAPTATLPSHDVNSHRAPILPLPVRPT